MIKKKLMSAMSLRTIYKKGFKQGSKLWRFGFYIALIYKVIKWLVSRPAPSKVDEYELAPGEYKVVVTNKSEKGNR